MGSRASILAVVIGILLTGCQNGPAFSTNGEPVAPPGGIVDYCARHPLAKLCGGIGE